VISFCRRGSRIARFRSVRCARSPLHSYTGNIIAGTLINPSLLVAMHMACLSSERGSVGRL
jgi:hypothetical protein